MVSARRLYQAWYAAFNPGFLEIPAYLALDDEEQAKWERMQELLTQFETALSLKEVIPGLGSMPKCSE